jgi:hypothetical protein
MLPARTTRRPGLLDAFLARQFGRAEVEETAAFEVVA